MKNRYESIPNTGKVKIFLDDKGTYATISEFDLERVEKFPHTWLERKAKNTSYVVGYYKSKKTGKYKNMPMHRWIMRPKADFVVDHINHNGLDNTASNLRIVPQFMNSHNPKRPKGDGVSKYRDKFMARVKIAGERKILGYFDTREEAKAAIRNEIEEMYAYYQDLEDDGETHFWLKC